MRSAVLSAAAETFTSLKGEWNILLEKSKARHIFVTWDWQDIWWRTFGDGLELHLIAVREGQDLVGIAPLVKQGRTVQFCGGADVSDYLDFVAVAGREAEVLSTVLTYLDDFGPFELDLHSLRHDSPTLVHLPEIARNRGKKPMLQEEETCPYVDLPGDWETYVASLSKKDRHELRRKIRRLEASAAFSWYVAPSVFDPSAYAETFLRLCRLSREEKALFLGDERMQLFFRSIVGQFQPSGVLRMYFMEISGERVSTALCFDQGEELWLYNSGFDPSYAHLSVGLLLKSYCVRDAIEAGKARFDFLRGREPYKYDLGGVDKPIYRLQITS